MTSVFTASDFQDEPPKKSQQQELTAQDFMDNPKPQEFSAADFAEPPATTKLTPPYAGERFTPPTTGEEFGTYPIGEKQYAQFTSGVASLGPGFVNFVDRVLSRVTGGGPTKGLSLEEIRALQTPGGPESKFVPRRLNPKELATAAHNAILLRAAGSQEPLKLHEIVTAPIIGAYETAAQLVHPAEGSSRFHALGSLTGQLILARSGERAATGAIAERMGIKLEPDRVITTPTEAAQRAFTIEKVNSFQALQDRIASGEHPELVGMRERLLQQSDATVVSTLVTAHKDLTPEGTTIIPGVERPGEVIGPARRSGVKSKIATYQRPDGSFDIALYGDESPLTLDANLASFRKYGFFEGQEASVNGGRVTFQGPVEGGAIKVRKISDGISYYTSLDQLRRVGNGKSAIIPTEIPTAGIYQRFQTALAKVTPAALFKDFTQFQQDIFSRRGIWESPGGDLGLPYTEALEKGPLANAWAAARKYSTRDEMVAEFQRVANEEGTPIPREALETLDSYARTVENINLNAAFDRRVRRFAELRGIPSEYTDGLINHFGQMEAKRLREVYMEPAELEEFNRIQNELTKSLGRPAGAQETLGAMNELPLSQAAATNGYRLDYAPDNSYVLVDNLGRDIGRFHSANAAREFINRAGQTEGPELIRSGGGEPPHIGGGAIPPSGAKPPGTYGADDGLNAMYDHTDKTALDRGLLGKVLDISRSAFDMFVGREAGFESVDNTFNLTKRFSTNQRMLEAAWGRYAANARGFAKQYLDHIGPMMKGMSKEQFTNVFRYIEAMSPAELTNEMLIKGRDEAVDIAHQVAALRVNTAKAIEYSRKVEGIKRDMQGQGPAIIQDELLKLTQAMNMDAEHVVAAGIFSGLRSRDINVVPIAEIARLADALIWDSPDRAGFAKLAGMGAKEILVAKQFDRLFDAARGVAGIPDYRAVSGYISHIRSQLNRDLPTPESSVLFQKGLGSTLEGQFVSEMIKTGELSAIDLNPFTVALRYVDTAFKARDFVPTYKEALKGFDAALRELSGSPGGKFLTRSMAERVRRYVSDLRGQPAPTNAHIRGGIEALNRALGLKIPPTVVESLMGTLTKTLSSALLAFRPYIGLRHLAQFFQFAGVRFGFKEMNEGLMMAEKPGAIDALKSSGVMSGLDFTNLVTPEESAATVLQKTGGSAWDAYKHLQNAGHIATLLPTIYEHTYAAVYLGMRKMALDVLSKVAKGELTKRAAYDKLALDSFAPAFRAEFDAAVRGNLERAAALIAKRAAKETIFDYQRANAPRGWNSIQGRFLTMFGTWPVHATELVNNMLVRGSARHRINYIARFGMAQGATYLAGRAIGVDLLGATVAHSLFWSGSPQVQLLQTTLTAVNGNGIEQKLAQDRLFKLIPSLEDARSMLVPGSYALGDWMQAIKEHNDPWGRYSEAQQAARALGAPTIRNKSWVDDYMEAMGLHFYDYEKTTAVGP